MPFEITVELREGYLFLAASGEVTEEAIASLGQTVRSECEARSCTGVVLDCQGMTGALAPGPLYFASQAFGAAVGPFIRVAYINPPDDWKPEDDAFSRTVASNSGRSLEVFPSEDEARQWLATR